MDRPKLRLSPRMTRDGDEPKGFVGKADEGTREADEAEVAGAQYTLHALSPELRERERILPPRAVAATGSAYKMLRTQVLQRLDQLGATTLGIFSPRSGAGKTLTAINLAITIAAERGRSAVLVDFDLRNPCVASRLGLAPAEGVESCLGEARPISEVAVNLIGYEGLTIVPARARVENSSELLAQLRASDVLGELQRLQHKPVILFDLPPVLEADDALVFSRYVQAGLLVVREGHTAREDVTRSIELLNQLTIVGTVLNASREPRPTAY